MRPRRSDFCVGPHKIARACMLETGRYTHIYGVGENISQIGREGRCFLAFPTRAAMFPDMYDFRGNKRWSAPLP